jgi:hypothetical protein
LFDAGVAGVAGAEECRIFYSRQPWRGTGCFSRRHYLNSARQKVQGIVLLLAYWLCKSKLDLRALGQGTTWQRI